MRLVALESQSAHTGIQLQVYHQSFAAGRGFLGVRLGQLQRRHILRHPVVDQNLRHVGGGVAQHQNGQLNPVMAQLLRLFQIGNGQIVRSQALQLLCHADSPVSVCVRLDHAQIFGLWSHLFPQLVIVIRQRIEIDLRPSPPKEFFHTLTFQISFVGVIRQRPRCHRPV